MVRHRRHRLHKKTVARNIKNSKKDRKGDEKEEDQDHEPKKRRTHRQAEEPKTAPAEKSQIAKMIDSLDIDEKGDEETGASGAPSGFGERMDQEDADHLFFEDDDESQDGLLPSLVVEDSSEQKGGDETSLQFFRNSQVEERRTHTTSTPKTLSLDITDDGDASEHIHNDPEVGKQQALSRPPTSPKKKGPKASSTATKKQDNESISQNRKQILRVVAVLLLITVAMSGVTIGLLMNRADDEEDDSINAFPSAAPDTIRPTTFVPEMPPSSSPTSQLLSTPFPSVASPAPSAWPTLVPTTRSPSVPPSQEATPAPTSTIDTNATLSPTFSPTPPSSAPASPAPTSPPTIMCMPTLNECATSYSELLMFHSLLEPGDTLAMCAGTSIPMAETLVVTKSNVTICCASTTDEGASSSSNRSCSLQSSAAGGTQIMIVRSAKLTIRGLSFAGGVSATGNGGNVFVDADDGEVEISNCVFTGGTAKNGGNLHIQDANSVLITNSQFGFGTADNGGGVSIKNTPTVTIRESSFDSNRCNNQGGGLRVYTDSDDARPAYSVSISLSQFSSNKASRGSGFYLKNLGDFLQLRLEDTYFGENEADVQGGVGFVFQAEGALLNLDAKISGNVGRNNTATGGTRPCSDLFLQPFPNSAADSDCLPIDDSHTIDVPESVAFALAVMP